MNGPFYRTFVHVWSVFVFWHYIKSIAHQVNICGGVLEGGRASVQSDPCFCPFVRHVFARITFLSFCVCWFLNASSLTEVCLCAQKLVIDSLNSLPIIQGRLVLEGH